MALTAMTVLVHADAPSAPPARALFAMDTAYHHKDLPRAAELDLVKRLGFVGVSEDLRPAEQIKTELAELKERGLKLAAVYAAASATPDGKIALPSDIDADLDALSGTGAVVWLHIGGKGPAFSALTGDEPMIATLRKLADNAQQRGLKVAVYPHFGEWTAHFGDALTLANRVNHPAFGVSFNLCHCLAVGDEKAVGDLLKAAGPRLFVVTLNGADAGVKGGDWSKLIQPLGAGSFDVRTVLDELDAINYDGPIGFQGYGIKGSAESILRPTMTGWQKVTRRD